MRTAVLITTLLGVVALAHGLRPRLDSQELRLNRLSARLANLGDKLDGSSGGAQSSNNVIDALNGQLNGKYGESLAKN